MPSNNINTVSKNEFMALFKERTIVFLLVIFILMTIFSTYIGWSAKNTITGVYQETVKEFSLKGVKEIPPNPFTGIPDLSILKNMIVYVFLIGSLLALVIGSNAFIRDRRSGVLRIIFSKPVNKQSYILGKITGIFETMLFVISVSFLLSLFSSILISGHILSSLEILKLLGFYGLSLIYLLIFAMTGLFFAIYSNSESIALLIPIMTWVLITFVMPQITSALVPTALLNPTNIQAVGPHSNFFHILQVIIKPFSISESYKEIGGILLETNSIPSTNTGFLQTGFQNLSGLIVMISYLAISILGSLYAINKFNSSEEGISE